MTKHKSNVKFRCGLDSAALNLNESNNRIKKSIEVLTGSQRGKAALTELQIFLNKNQAGLDMIGSRSVVVLVQEFFFNHRRDFL